MRYFHGSFIFFYILAEVAAFLVVECSGWAAIYQYKDEQGKLFFVSERSQVPEKYQDKLIAHEESKDFLTDEELAKVRQEEAETRRQLKERRRQQLKESQEVFAQLQEEAKVRRQSEREARMRDLEASAKPRTGWQNIEIKGDRVILEVVLNHRFFTQTLRLLLGTSASSTYLYEEVAPGLGIDVKKLVQSSFAMADGSKQSMGGLLIDRVSTGPVSERHIQVFFVKRVYASTDYDGTLGMNFLKKHPFEIDYKRSRIYWKESLS